LALKHLKKKKFTSPSISDKNLEVIGILSSLHVGGVIVGVTQGIRLGQANQIRLKIESHAMPFQVDGEPFTTPEGGSFITINHRNQYPMLVSQHYKLIV